MIILVPIDFTPVTENALKYTLGLTDILAASKITLFHVVASEKDTPGATTKLRGLVDKYAGQTNVPLEFHVSPGNIFDLIGKTATGLGASLIVMGTHGIKGMQRLIGSRAMKVITNSETPYIVVQNKPFRPIRNILIPVDYTRESKQMLPLLQSLNDRFKANIFLVQQKAKDEFINDKIRNNMGYFKTFLDENRIKYRVVGSYHAGSKYKEVLKEGDAIEADLLVTAIDPETDITDYIMGVEEQKLVANESQIPALCINIKHFMSRKGGIFELVA